MRFSADQMFVLSIVKQQLSTFPSYLYDHALCIQGSHSIGMTKKGRMEMQPFLNPNPLKT